MERALSMVEELSELQTYITATAGYNGHMRCYSCVKDCEDGVSCNTCKLVTTKVQKCVDEFIEKRMKGFRIIEAQCGQDGIAYIVQNNDTKRVIKAIFCLNVVVHAKRYSNWMSASYHRIGPKVEYGNYCELNMTDGKVVGISLIGMHYWPPCEETESAKKIVKLIRLTSAAGILHTDPNYNNIRCGPQNAIFIDWENMIRVDENTATVAEYLMLMCMIADSYKPSEESLYKDVIQKLTIDENKVKRFITSLEDEDVRKTFEVALVEGCVQEKTMLEFYKNNQTRQPLSCISATKNVTRIS